MDTRPSSRDTVPMEYAVTVSHDEKNGVWFVQASDVPGLHAEASTLDDLVEIVADLAPDLVSANIPNASGPIRLRVQHVVDA